MINPYVILTALLVWLGSLAGVGWWQRHDGISVQKAIDQVQFDKINADLTEQKAIAANTYKSAQATIIQTLAERDKFKTQLEKTHAQNQAATNALRLKYAGVGLRFPAAQNAGCGAGSASAVPPSAGTARIEPAPVVQLSDETSTALKQLAFDADQLADDYRKCYSYAEGIR